MACHIALEEPDADFERVVVRLAKSENRALAYLGVHPHGFVPVLEFDEGRRLSEAAAILQHVARRLADARLLPEAGTIEEGAPSSG